MCRNRFLIDGIFVLLCMAMAFSEMNNADKALHPIDTLVPYLISYCLFRVLFSLNHECVTFVLITVLSVLCIKELYEGYTQVFMYFGKKTGQEICTGSFSNSGLYGCFLAVCASTFVACCVMAGNRYIKIVLIALTVFSMLLLPVTMSRASLLAFVASVIMLILNLKWGKLFVRRNWIVLSVIVLLLGTGAYVVKKDSADGRMLMNRIGLQIIMRNGLRGVGRGYYAGVYGEEQCNFFMELGENDGDGMDINGIPESMRKIADCPCYAFNEYLKVGVENGLVAMLLLMALIIVGIMASYKSGNCLCYPLLTLAVFSFFSYPFQTKFFTYLLMAFLASAGKNENRRVMYVAFYCIIAFVACVYVKTSSDYKEKTNARSYQYNGDNLFECQPSVLMYKDFLTDSYNIVDQNILFYCGQAYNKSGEYYKSDSILNIGTLISSDPMFWNVMGNNSLALGNYREAEERYKHAFYMVPNRLYPLYLLAKLYNTEGDSARFLKMADLVEEFVPKIESPKTERLRSEIREIKTTYQK